MNYENNILRDPIQVLNMGLETFSSDLTSLKVPVVQIDWKPEPMSTRDSREILMNIYKNMDEIRAANEKAMDRVLSAQPTWVDVGLAKDVIPGFTEKTITHAGPPISWEKMCGPMQGAVIGAIIYEKSAENEEEARKVAASGEFRFAPCHHFNAVGPMSGIISAHMPVIVVEDKLTGARAYSTFNNEGRGRPLSFGAFGQDTQDMLLFIRNVMGPALGKVVREAGGVNLKSIIAKAIQMGDDCHNRLVGATSLFWRELVPHFNKAGVDSGTVQELGELIRDNDWFFLNFSMAASKVTMDSARNIPMSTLVTAMARNGVEVGIQISGMNDEWFTVKAPKVKGIYFPGFSEEDANPDLGDSAITETSGIGAFAMAAALPMTQLVGGSIQDAIQITEKMGKITLGESKAYTIPILQFTGTPTGIDMLKVIETGISPIINTGIAHKKAGIGAVGAGIVEFPMEGFYQALKSFNQKLQD